MFNITPVMPAQLSEESIERRKLTSRTIIESLAPGISLDNGFINNVVLHLQSVLFESTNQGMANIQGTVNPLVAGQQANLSSDVVEATAGYYGLTRVLASVSTGTVRIRVSANVTVVVPRGAQFATSDGIVMEVSSTFTGKPLNSELRNANDRQLSNVGDGFYEMIVDVQSAVAGSAVQVPAGESLSLVSLLIPNFVSAVTESNLTGGRDAETDTQLLNRITAAFPAKSMSSRHAIRSLLTTDQNVTGSLYTSTIGYGDPELRRTDLGIVSADIYARTAPLPSQIAVDLTATVIEELPGARVKWRIPVARETAPGFYQVVSVSPSDGINVVAIDVLRSYDSSDVPTDLVPFFKDAQDAAFSRYQAADLLITTPRGSGVVVGSTQTMTVVFEVMPAISQLQDVVGRREFRFVGGDSLVKAPIPVFANVSINLFASPGVVSIDVDAIRTRVANLFNFQGFAKAIYTSQISCAVSELLPSGVVVQSVDGLTQAIMPNGQLRVSRHTDVFKVEPDVALSFSSRTAAFFLASGSVSINTFNSTEASVV